jgi:hypothetical protein
MGLQGRGKGVGTLVVDRIRMYETPQTGTWLFCFKVYDPADNQPYTFHIPNKEYEGDGIDIDLIDPTAPEGNQRLEISDVDRGAEISWWMGLDDDEADVCASDSAEDQCQDKFIAKSKGRRQFSPNGLAFKTSTTFDKAAARRNAIAAVTYVT